MKIKIYEDRRLLNEKENFGSQYENLATTLIFEFPEYVEKDGIKLATKDLNKTIIFNIEGDNELPIIEDKFSFPYDITKLGEVEWNIALKERSETEDMTDKLIWYSETMVSKFEKTNEGKNNITTEKLDSFNVITTVLNEKIAEVEALKVDIGDYKKALDNKVDKEKGKGLSTNDFTNILKEKLENLENYNDEEIRNLLNGSLKEVEYSANDGIMTFTQNDGSEIKVDLPLELLIESGRYDEVNSQIVLVLANGNSINIPVSDLLDDFYGKNETYNKTEVDNLIAKKQRQIEALESEIDDLIEENKSQQEEIDMLTADYRENTIEGETVAVSDGLPKSKIKADVNGNSYQYSTEGYNLLQVDETNWELTDNGIKSLSKASSSTGVNLSAVDINLKANTTYYLNFVLLSRPTNSVSFSVAIDKVPTDSLGFLSIEKTANYTIGKVVTKTYTPTKDETLKVNMWGNKDNEIFEFQCWITTDSTKTKYEPYTNGASPNIEYPQEVEVVEGVNELQIDEEYWELTDNGIKNLYKNSSVLLGKEINLKANITYYINFVLLSRPTVSTTFVAYIDNVSNDSISAINIEVESRFTIGKVVTKSYTPTKDEVLTFKMWGNENGETFEFQYWVTTVPNAPYLPYGHIGLIQRGKNVIQTKFDDWESGEYNASTGNKGDNTGRIRLKELLRVNPNETYYFNINSTNTNLRFVIRCYGKNKEFVYSYGSLATGVNTFTPREDCYYLGITIYDTKDLSSDLYETFKTMFENGELKPFVCSDSITDKTFEPYIEPIVKPINLQGNSIAKVGDVKDLLNIGVDGSCKINKNTGDTILDDTSYWEKEANPNYSNGMRFRTFLSKALNTSARTSCLSNMFKLDLSTAHKEGYSFLFNGFFYGYFPAEITTDVKLKALLAEKNLNILYPLKTPETINLPSIEPITLFEGTNVFELVTNLETTMAVTYKISNKSLDKRISALESALIGG